MMTFAVVVGLSCLKLLFIPAYRSTDFEVHRNWLAITNSLPIEKWYVDETSEWTLDYPPFFAWFEFFLGKVAYYFDPEMLKVTNLNYSSEMTILFQRLSVIATDLVFAYGCKLCCQQVGRAWGRQEVVNPLFMVLFGNAGLLMVDHIHFQYNGFLFGILFISIARMLQKRELESAFWFSVLLNLKHIYIYMAPAYFVYLLRSYCLAFYSVKDRVRSLASLAGIVILVFAFSFGPFITRGQLMQVLSRLFPFKRGLSHAYWAPNFWAFYNFLDKFLFFISQKVGWVSGGGGVASMTGGLVQQYDHMVLPSIPPIITLILTILAIVPCLVNLWRTPCNSWQFVRSLVLCAFGAYMFGWHVHEKAILMVILPFGLLCMLRKAEAQTYTMLIIVGHFSLFPLLFKPQEMPIKVGLLLLHTSYTTYTLAYHWFVYDRVSSIPLVPLCSPFESLYLLGLLPLFLYQEGGHASLPFLPLMMTSVYCALGLGYCWLRYYYLVLFGGKKNKKKAH